MGIVYTGITMSLDGFIAGPNDDVMNLFGWYMTGDIEIPVQRGRMSLKVSKENADVLQASFATTGAMIGGRRIFNMTGGWDGSPPFEPCFIVTHNPPQDWVNKESAFTFVTDGVESAVRQAKAAAGDKNVAIATPDISQQAMKLGLVDELHIALVPVLLGEGIPLFKHLGIEPVQLEIMRVVAAKDVTHLNYRILK